MGGYLTLDLQMCGCTGIVTSPVDYTERVSGNSVNRLPLTLSQGVGTTYFQPQSKLTCGNIETAKIIGPRKLSTCTDRHIHAYQRRSLRHGENDAAAPASEFLTCDWHTHPEFSVRQDKRRSMSRDASLDGMCDAAGLVVDGYRLEMGERTI
ncbi:uncharacterized protein EAE97_010015 [Botrytis byssoidea]|uniref:Uncharacterized protein n=1 Tax=Botrytis byssoidea TaxID=139641 RepID=A0A9P5HZA7_9HELO|nr:uncharacterized protein EAE97_010015 [Botrytis byssoidea]KAF7927340.1 hypothetical protein EAE97_010015 [Botrytis byssoidea]